jgi:hypothetical protein
MNGIAPPTPSAGSPFQVRPEPGPAASRQPAIEASQLSHNIPARLTAGQPHTIEVHLRRGPLNPPGSTSRPAPDRRDVVTARAISVRLRPARGRFSVDQPSLETQWDTAADAGRLAGEAAVWRFTVVPGAIGRGELALSVAARTIGADGMILETTLPDQVFEVRTRRDWSRTTVWIGTLLLLAGAGIVVAEFASGLGFFKTLFALVWK